MNFSDAQVFCAYFLKASDAGDISPPIFLDFPPNFRLRMRHQCCTSPMSRQFLRKLALFQQLVIIPVHISAIQTIRKLAFFNNLLINPFIFTIYALLSRFLFCRDLRSFSANFLKAKIALTATFSAFRMYEIFIVVPLSRASNASPEFSYEE